MPGASELARNHQLLLVGTVAGVVVAAAAFQSLRSGSGSGAGGAGAISVADLAAASQAGAAAAASGFQPGVDLASAGLQAGVSLGQAGLDTGGGLAGSALDSVASSLQALAASQATLGQGILSIAQGAGGMSGTGVAGSSGGAIPGGAGTGDHSAGGASGAGAAPSPAGGSVTLTFSRPTTVYARTHAGLIGSRKVAGSAGDQIQAAQLVVPHDPKHGTGGVFWRLLSGPNAGWLVSAGDASVAVSG